MASWNSFWRIEIFYDHLVHIAFVWYIFSGFGIMYQEKIWQPWCRALLPLTQTTAKSCATFVAAAKTSERRSTKDALECINNRKSN
jgi:hypothetical protein